MKLSKSIFLPALIIGLLWAPSAFSQRSKIQSLTDTLSRRLAIKNQLLEPPQDIKEQFEQNPMRLADSTNEQLLHEFNQAFGGELLLKDFKTALRNNISKQIAAEASEWLNDQNGQRITQADRQYYSLQGKRKRIIAMYKMDKNQPSQRQKQLISAISDSSQAAKTSVESSVIILRSVIKALNALSDQRNFGDARIEAIVQNFKAQIQAQASRQINQQMMVRYYDLESGTLHNYLAFLKTEAGRQLFYAIHQSMQAAYQKASDRFLQSIKQSS